MNSACTISNVRVSHWLGNQDCNLISQATRKKEFTNLWEWYGRGENHETPVHPRTAPNFQPNDSWRPNLCQVKGTYYTFEGEDAPRQPGDVQEAPATVTPSHLKPPKERVKICAICRRVPVDPITLDCGHLFCRICIAKLRSMLIQDFPERIKDHRTMLGCPFPSCHHLMLCRPIVNGDFRFHQIHPEDKVQTVEIPECEIEALKRFRVSIDIDFTKKKKNDLFINFPDV